MFSTISRVVLSKVRLRPVYRSIHAPTNEDVAGDKTLSADDMYGRPPAWSDVESLSNVLFERIIFDSAEFLVLDKPAGLSVAGQKPDQTPSTGDTSLDTALSLSIRDCLKPLSRLIGTSELHMSCLLPVSCSGLVLLSKTRDHYEISRSFYEKAEKNEMPGFLFQSLLTACWGVPREDEKKPASFGMESTFLGDLNVKVSFKSTEPSGGKSRRGTLLKKCIGHRVVAKEEKEQASLVEVVTQSTFRGVVELYLLHQGCTVLGERLQASRMRRVMNRPVILTPDKASLAYTPPPELRRLLGVTKATAGLLPTHMHRSRLGVPVKVSGKRIKAFEQVISSSVPDYFRFSLDRMGLALPDYAVSES